MNESIMKTQIRDSIRLQRMALSDKQIKKADSILAEQFMSVGDKDLKKIISSAECIALYKAVGGELPCDGVFEFFKNNNRTLCYPKVKGDVIEFFEVKNPESDLTEGSYGILEPKDSCRKIYPGDIDLMIVPAVAYNEEGLRLGHGGGFYDRWLNAASADGKAPYTIGVCYEFQLYSALPVEKHDYAVDCVMCVGLSED